MVINGYSFCASKYVLEGKGAALVLETPIFKAHVSLIDLAKDSLLRHSGELFVRGSDQSEHEGVRGAVVAPKDWRLNEDMIIPSKGFMTIDYQREVEAGRSIFSENVYAYDLP